MPDKLIYEYAVIRLVPRVEREEFINIGVLLFCKSKNFLDIRSMIDRKRMASFQTDIDFDLLDKYLQAWKSICAGEKEGGKIGQLEKSYRFRWLASNRSTILQTSKIHPGLCVDPEEELNELFDRFVLL